MYESGGQAGQVVDEDGLSPTLSPGKRGGVQNMPIVATRSDREYKERDIAPTVRCNDKGDIRVKVIHKHKTGNVKQGYSQTGSVFDSENAIAPTLDLAAGRLFKVPKKDEKEKDN